MNRPRKYGIKFKGVYASAPAGIPMWQAQISINGSTLHLGVFASAEEAAHAYDSQARALGRKLNFPDAEASYPPAALACLAGTPVGAAPTSGAAEPGATMCSLAYPIHPRVHAVVQRPQYPAQYPASHLEACPAFWQSAATGGLLGGPTGGAQRAVAYAQASLVQPALPPSAQILLPNSNVEHVVLLRHKLVQAHPIGQPVPVYGSCPAWCTSGMVYAAQPMQAQPALGHCIGCAPIEGMQYAQSCAQGEVVGPRQGGCAAHVSACVGRMDEQLATSFSRSEEGDQLALATLTVEAIFSSFS